MMNKPVIDNRILVVITLFLLLTTFSLYLAIYLSC